MLLMKNQRKNQNDYILRKIKKSEMAKEAS